jgi:long-chain acyl-CoA synthetase
VASALARVNQRLSVIERVRHHTLVAAFTMENGFLTPTQKVKRRVVMEAYADRLHAGSA